ncbi:hypothetical protein ACSL103130_11865 [Actinomyces slackii]|uniref:Uncharacterized protein n=2 Tax=Actinomyces slackii TaxID=52774 RepID=A0A3S4WK05_9ACTO|nr:Uncharacterised protein [Actinomyces slackii]
MRTKATDVEFRGSNLSLGADSLETVSSTSLSTLATEVQTLRDHATALDARVDMAIIHNTGDTGNVPQTGTLSYEVPGKDSTDPVAVQQQLGTTIGQFGGEIASSGHKRNDPRIAVLESYMGKWNANQTVMGSMYDELGEEGTLALTTTVGLHTGVRPGSSDEQVATAKKTLELLKAGLNTATSGWSDEKAEKFGKNLIDVAVNGVSSNSRYAKVSSGGPLTEALAFLVYNNSEASGSFIYGAATPSRLPRAEGRRRRKEESVRIDRHFEIPSPSL